MPHIKQRETERSLLRHKGGRPWRPLGAAICGLATIMFILGVVLLDETRGRVGFVVYWLTVLVLVLWICILAFKDIRHTRRLAIVAKSEMLAKLKTELSDRLNVNSPDDQQR